jgi:hypothetical protein
MSNTVKQGDTHSITLTVYESVGGVPTPLDLTGSTVRLLAKLGTETTVILTAALGVDPGTVEHTLTGTLAAGTYSVEVEVTQGGAITTAPTEGYATLIVTPDLG